MLEICLEDVAYFLVEGKMFGLLLDEERIFLDFLCVMSLVAQCIFLLSLRTGVFLPRSQNSWLVHFCWVCGILASFFRSILSEHSHSICCSFVVCVQTWRTRPG